MATTSDAHKRDGTENNDTERAVFAFTNDSPPECNNCKTALVETARRRDAPVDDVRRIARVFGDNDDNVERCPACTSYQEFTTAARKGTRIATNGVKLQGDGLGSQL